MALGQDQRWARIAGVSRSTLHRALKAGRVSYETDANGARWIDPSEIARVFGGTGDTGQRHEPRHAETQAPDPLVEQLLARIETQEATIADLRAERGRLLGMIEQREQRLLPSPSWWRRWRSRVE
jgi:hypothetical protein